MLTDIFAHRYEDTPIWNSFGEPERRLLVQGFRIVVEQIFPYWTDGKENPRAKAFLKTVHDKLSMELGLSELAPRAYAYQSTWNGKPCTNTGVWTYNKVCKDFVCRDYNESVPADRYMKERISFFELAFREREYEILEINKNFSAEYKKARITDKLRPSGGMRVPGNRADGLKALNDRINVEFREAVIEFNERLRHSGCGLNYHNGFIQLSVDERTYEQLEEPFWDIVSDAKWKNVDVDMKEAVDRRDNNDRDPCFYAARALESAIKIISDEKGWTHGTEKGAHSYIDNLGSKKNGYFVTGWEKDSLKAFFSSVRNPFGHGPGSAEMPALTPQQTDWAIEYCMAWVKSLVRRM